ncbi:hypothetical protein V1525DRAFT_418756 [Lipomyces kononenkoae]|uniref:Uncharacterized protein n=1 Tax=Lipomyces kononenkoae TaxID=34357 RepID=A0ACC3T347_LIPKO
MDWSPTAAAYDKPRNLTSYGELEAQFNLVTDACYPPLLASTLEKLLSTSEEFVTQWATAHKCCRTKLVQQIITALEYDINALEVLTICCRSKELRDEALSINPTMLDKFLTLAMASDRDYEKFSPICFSLLSHDLPPTILPPSSLSTFIRDHVVQKLINSTTISTIGNLYTLLSHGHTHCLTLLSSAQHYALHAALGESLSNNDTSILLLSLACIARLTASSTTPDTAQDASDASDLFGGSKSVKVLRLAGDIVVAAASAGSIEISDTVKREGDIRRNALLVTLATDIANRVNVEDLRNWITGKVCARLSEKVVEKCVARDIDVRIVNSILGFFALLHSIVPNTKALQTIIEFRIDRALGERLDGVECPLIADRVWAYAKLCRPPTNLGRYMEAAYRFGAHIPEPSATSVRRLRIFQYWIDSILEVLMLPPDNQIQTQYRDTLAAYFSDKQAQAYYRGLNNSKPALEARHFASSLAEDMSRFKCKLAILPLFVYASLRTELPNHQMISEMHSKVLSMLPTSSLENSRISSTAHIAPSISIIEHPATPSQESNSSTRMDWRARLLSELTQDTRRQHESVTTFVTHLCRDLERRCEQVEVPLRQLEVQVSNLKREKELLEHDLQDSQEALKEREAEIKQLSNKCLDLTGDLSDRNERCELLLSDNDSLRKEITRVVSEAQVRHSRDRSEFQKKLDNEEEDHMIKMSNLQDKLDQAEAMVKESQIKAEDFEARSRELERENTNARQRITTLDKDKSEMQMKLDSQEKTIFELEQSGEMTQGTIAQLQREVEGLRVHATELKQQLQHQSSRVTELTEAYPAQLRIREQEFLEQISKLEQLHDERNMISQKEHHDTLNDLKQEISRTKKQAEESTSELVREVLMYQTKLKTLKQATSSRIKQLKTRISQMAENEDRQNRELARVQALSKKLIGVMASNIELANTPAGAIPGTAANRPVELEDEDADYFSPTGTLKGPEGIPTTARKEPKKSATATRNTQVLTDATNREQGATGRERIIPAPVTMGVETTPPLVKQSRRMTVTGGRALTPEIHGGNENENERFAKGQTRSEAKFVHLVGTDIPSTGSTASSTSSTSMPVAKTELDISDGENERAIDSFEDDDNTEFTVKKSRRRSGSDALPMATSTPKGERMLVNNVHRTTSRPEDQTTYYGSTPDLPREM